MSILYLTYDGLNDPLGQSQIVPYLQGLSDRGHEIIVVSFEKSDSSATFGHGLDKITWIKLRYHKFPPVLSTLFDIYVLRIRVRAILQHHHIEMVHCRSYITSLVGSWARRRFNVRFVFDMRGFWADERVDGGLWNKNNWLYKRIYRYFKSKEREFLLSSDAIVSLTRNAKSEILSWAGLDIDPSKISIIPTCVDLHLFDPEKVERREMSELKGQLGIKENEFVLLYLGSLGTWYMLSEMLDFYSELKRRITGSTEGFSDIPVTSVKFLFVSKDHTELRRELASRDLEQDDIIMTSCRREDVPLHISICDASIFFIMPTYSKKASAATKMGEIMSMGKPVITNTGWGDVAELVTTECGVLVKELNNIGYRSAIKKFEERYMYDPAALRSAARLHFSLQTGIDRYHSIYSGKVMSGGGQPQ